MKIRCYLIICLTLILGFTLRLTAQTAEKKNFVISEKVKSKLISDWKEIFPVHDLDVARKLEKEKLAEQWACTKFDIFQAEIKENKRLPGRRVFRNSHAIDSIVKEMFIKDLDYASYEKELKQDVNELLAKYPRTSREKGEISKKAMSFFRENKMITETSRDKIGEAVVRHRMRYIGGENNQDGTEVVLAENVQLIRFVDGLPVLNSHLQVEFDAFSGEVVSLTQEKWTPLAPGATKEFRKTGKKPAAAVEWIRQRAEKKFKTHHVRTELDDIRQAWYQTDVKLVPVLVCNVKSFDDEESGAEPYFYTDIINLTDDPGIPDKWADLGVSWPQDAPAGNSNLDSFATCQ